LAQLLERMVRTALQRYWRWTRGLTLGAQGLVTDEAGRILLVRHTYRSGWHFPGGGVDKGELVADAVVREIREEAGLAVTAPPELIGIYSNEAVFRGDHVLLFRIIQWQPLPDGEAPDAASEIAEKGFFALDALPAGLSAPAGRRIAELYRGVPVTGKW
jgi:ADP-ribose pyrophosphatase YjhB (NUDIX family)